LQDRGAEAQAAPLRLFARFYRRDRLLTHLDCPREWNGNITETANLKADAMPLLSTPQAQPLAELSMPCCIVPTQQALVPRRPPADADVIEPKIPDEKRIEETGGAEFEPDRFDIVHQGLPVRIRAFLAVTLCHHPAGWNR
jgi:hypothetical protein